MYFLLFSKANADDAMLLSTIALCAVFILLITFVTFFYISHRRTQTQTHNKIRIPAMQETVKPQRRDRGDADASEQAAVIAAAIAVCTENNKNAQYRVVSYKRIR